MTSMQPTTKTQRLGYAVCGLLAALTGMAVGHLVAAFVDPASSPVLAVGSTVIDATPTPVKEWAVRSFGTADKAVLLSSVAVVTALAAMAIGLVARRRQGLAGVLVVVLAALAGLAAVLRPTASPADVIPAFAAAVVGIGVLNGLLRLLPGHPPAATSTHDHESPLDHSAQADGVPSTTGRRTFLVGAAGATVGAAAVGALGQRLAAAPTLPASVSLPAPASAAPGLPTGLDGKVKGITKFVTDPKDFYRVDTALVIPRVDVESWKLEVDGMVERPFSITFDELVKMPMVERDITLNCVSNEVGGPYISSTRWQGVLVRDLLKRAGVKQGVDQIFSESTDGMTISTPIEALTDDRDAMVAVAMGGQPLPARHGFPARLVTPGLYGFVGATKWLTKLTATTYAKDKAYWTQRDWATDGRVKTQARIDTPRGLATYAPGTIVVGGVAWAQGRGIEEVEVQVDKGPWQKATLGPDGGTDYWRQWYWAWDAKSGRHDITVRATDGTGTVQTAERADPFPGGASGYHSIVVIVS